MLKASASPEGISREPPPEHMATNQYTRRISVRATPEEARVIERRAEEAGLSKSRYLAEAGVQAAGTKELDDLRYQLRRAADRANELIAETQAGRSVSSQDVEKAMQNLEQAVRKAREVL